VAEQKKTESMPETAAKAAATHVAVEDFTWCGSKVKSGETVVISNAGLARDLVARKIIRER